MPTPTIRFFVPERPFVKQRPRFGRGQAWTPAATAAGEEAIRWYAKKALPEGFVPFNGPVRLTIEFRFERAKKQVPEVRTSTWHAMSRGGDLSNLVKLVEDALNPPPKGFKSLWPGMWNDDGQVASLHAEKLWADDEHPEGTTVTVEAL